MKFPVLLLPFSSFAFLLSSSCRSFAFVTTQHQRSQRAFHPRRRRQQPVSSLVSLKVASTTTAAAIPFNMTHASPSPLSTSAASELLEFPEEALHFDSYSGVIVNAQLLNHVSPVAFARTLESSLELWKMEQRRGIWIHIPKSHGHLIPPSLDAGFDFHSCASDLLILKQWLPSTESRLPFGPTHQVGVGALVLSTNQDKMLVVQEKSGPAADAQLWKMPTGLLDPGEDVGEAAVRELKEETGLDGTLQRVLCMRQAHSDEGRKASDLFFICLLTLDNPDQTPVLQEAEIAQLTWMSPDDYANQDLWKESPVYQELNASILRAAKHETAGMVEIKLPVGFRPGSNTLYMSNT